MYRPVNLAFISQWLFLYTHVVAPHFIGTVPAPVSSPNSIPLWNQKGGMACRETFQLKRESPRERGPFLVSRVRINSNMHLTHMLLTRLFERSFPTPSVALPSGVGSLFSFRKLVFKKKKECLRRRSLCQIALTDDANYSTLRHASTPPT